MAKSESTKKLSSSFSMDNILGQSPQKFDEDQKLRNNHILTVVDNLNSNMNSFFQKFESNQISR